MRIPTHLQQRVQQLGLRSWVREKKFPRDHYFKSVEIYRERILSRPAIDGHDEGVVNRGVAVMLGAELDHEGALTAHAVSKNTADMTDDAEWAKICEAAGWCLLQLYLSEHKDSSNG